MGLFRVGAEQKHDSIKLAQNKRAQVIIAKGYSIKDILLRAFTRGH
jgi:hypothetical protein